MSVSEDARKMKAYIEEHGWIACDYFTASTGAACIVGAMNMVRYDNAFQESDSSYASNADDPTYVAMANYLDVHYVGNDWNDAPGRTKEEVLEMLENVAIKHESDEYRSG